MKDSVHTALGLDDRGILIAGTNLASSKDGKVGGSWIDTDPPARRRSGHLNVVATIQQGEDRRLNPGRPKHGGTSLRLEGCAVGSFQFVSMLAKFCVGLTGPQRASPVCLKL